ncbi:nucleoside-diphosphate-sugar epimerases [Vibrio sp. JCM 19236]|nr:nucleoside-diphosphate-sugar epimerases [Vibrio sp. JCM 19236]
MENKKQNLIIAGATGLIGGHALEIASLQSDQFEGIYSITRRTSSTHSCVLELISENLDIDLDIYCNIGMICLGSTKKQAGSNEALYKIDHDLVLHVAKQMKEIGVTKLAVVSSIGANPSSPSHYLKCKGEMERDVQALGFTNLLFVRPGPLVGRKVKMRADEKLVQMILNPLSPLMIGPLEKYRPIHARDIALYMLKYLMENEQRGTHYAYQPEITGK